MKKLGTIVATIAAALFLFTGVNFLTAGQGTEGIVSIVIGVILLYPAWKLIQGKLPKKEEKPADNTEPVEQEPAPKPEPKYYDGFLSERLPLEGYLSAEIQRNIEESYPSVGDELQYDPKTGEVFVGYRKIGKLPSVARKMLQEKENYTLHYDGDDLIVPTRGENYKTEPLVRVIYR